LRQLSGGTIDEETALRHEVELKETPDFWGDMIEHGAIVRRFKGTNQSALEILMEFSTKATVTLDIQRELVDEAKPISETAAGNAVNEELHRLENKYKVKLERVQEQMGAALAEKDLKVEQTLKTLREKTERQLERIHGDQILIQRERREEIRRLEAENDRRFSLMKQEHADNLEKTKLEGERRRAEDKSGFRDQMRSLQMENASLNASFRDQMRQMQIQNDHLASSYERSRAEIETMGSPSHSSGGSTGTFLNLAAAGALAFANPALGVPAVIGALVDLIND
jgi:hypothetical protein